MSKHWVLFFEVLTSESSLQ